MLESSTLSSEMEGDSGKRWSESHCPGRSLIHLQERGSNEGAYGKEETDNVRRKAVSRPRQEHTAPS